MIKIIPTAAKNAERRPPIDDLAKQGSLADLECRRCGEIVIDLEKLLAE